MKRVLCFFLVLGSFFCFFVCCNSAGASGVILHHQAVSGSRGVYLGDFKFSADIEPVRIQGLRLYNEISGSDVVFDTVDLWDGDNFLGNSRVINGLATWNNLSVEIPRFDSRTLTLRGNFNGSREVSNVSGRQARFVVRGSSLSFDKGGDIFVVGMDSGNVYEYAISFFIDSDSVEVTQHIYDTRLAVNFHDTHPMCFQGSAMGDEIDLFNFVIRASENQKASQPQKAIIESITITAVGNAHVTDMALYSDADDFSSPVAVASVDHATIPTYDSKITPITFNLSGQGAVIPYDYGRVYKLRGRVTAQVDSASPERSVRFSIANFGSPSVAGDIIWQDNGTLQNNPYSQRVTWVDDPDGKDMLRSPQPLIFGFFSSLSPCDTSSFSVDAGGLGEGTDFGGDLVVSENIIAPSDSDTILSLSSSEGGGAIDTDFGGNAIVADVSSGKPFDDFIVDTDILVVLNPFPDVSVEGTEGIAVVDMVERGVIQGYPDGRFHGDYFVNRVEALKFLLVSRYGDVVVPEGDKKFPDVFTEEWYAPYVYHGVDLGIIKGYPDGLFRPANTVITAEFLKMLSLTFDLEPFLSFSYTDVSYADWFAEYAGVAEKYELFPGLTTRLFPAKELTRYEIAVAIHQLLKKLEPEVYLKGFNGAFTLFE